MYMKAIFVNERGDGYQTGVVACMQQQRREIIVLD